ncbi:MAG TPA: hypothetical protein VHV77_08995 [Pirellulales bacterium]|jgi:hypothetical protein|nr:hypothetical protein [Pirellulales bacterium]
MTPQRTIAIIIVGVLAWGLYHAVGAYQLNHDPRRFVVVIVCVVGYLGFWGVMLAARRARLRRQERDGL